MNFKKLIALLTASCMLFLLTLSFVSITGATTEKTTFSSTSPIYVYGKNGMENTKISPQILNGTSTLILPSTISETAVPLFFDSAEGTQITISGEKGSVSVASGEPIDLTELCKNENYTITIRTSPEKTDITLKILFSRNISTVYLSSDSPESNGRKWVEASIDKSNKATGSMVMLKSDSSIVYDGKLTQIKGRGNTTWQLDKKPYQIKLETKTDLLETGDDKNASKTWILLANCLDATVMRNSLALNTGRMLGMDDNIDSTYADLYYDGEYRGNYMLTEKVEIGNGRASITDMEEKNADANPNVDLEALPTKNAITRNGAIYTYCKGMKSPEDITGGYLLEMDYRERAFDEVCYFRTTRGQYVVVKSPEFASKEEMNYIATLYQEYEDAVYNNGINPTTGKTYNDYVDAKSIACYYLINELSKSRDCFKSSAYLHKEAGEDKMYMGPLWDYDMSFGKGGDDYIADDTPEGTITPESAFNIELLFIEDFYQTVKSVYEDELYPIITNNILNPDPAAENSIAHYTELLSSSALCNAAMWHTDYNWHEETAKLTSFITLRKDYIKQFFETFPSLNNLAEDDYLDVLPFHPYHDDVKTACALGYVTGFGDYLFKPEELVTRAQAVQSLYNISGNDAVKFKKYFNDVDTDAWFSDAVIWAVENSILGTTADNLFNPADNLSTKEFLTMLYMYNHPNKWTFSSISGLLNSSENTLDWAIKNNIVNDTDDHSEYQKIMTRAELASILVKYHEAFLK